MPREIRWTSSIAARLTLLSLLFLGVAGAMVATSLLMLEAVEQDTARSDVLTRGRYRAAQILLDAEYLMNATGDARLPIIASLRQHLEEMERRFVALREGDSNLGVEPPDETEVLAGVIAREDEWNENVVPKVEQLMAAATRDEAVAIVRQLRPAIETSIDRVQAAITSAHDATADEMSSYRAGLIGLSVVVLIVVALVIIMARNLSRRVRVLHGVTERFAAGQLDETAPVSGLDEIGALGTSVNTMVAALRKSMAEEKDARAKVETALRSIAEAASRLTSASAEVVAATAQQSTSIQEQTSAVAQTVTSVDEIAATSEQSAERSAAVADAARRSEESTRAGQKAVAESVGAMESIRQKMDILARSILVLAEKGQAIGEVTAFINDIAERSHVLALNAAIEASRAGEHGRSFAVVASEVKALADQCKQATAQVRLILGEVQSSTNTAVMESEEGTKSAQAAARLVVLAGQSIEGLAAEVFAAARIASQTVASAGQQSTGMSQIRHAMRSIQEATQQNLAATRQTERAALDMGELGAQLERILASHGR
jgi:methyl-accepting chemotaxis protein